MMADLYEKYLTESEFKAFKKGEKDGSNLFFALIVLARMEQELEEEQDETDKN